MTLWLLGDQLSHDGTTLADTERVLMIESWAFADRKPYHPQKLTLVFAAMRHFRDELRERGIAVDYYETETFGDGLDRHFEAHPEDTLGTFATDALSSKPYVSLANYLDDMTDHCADCTYDPAATTGDDACPFNALYWDFLAAHEETLRGTGRMGLVYAHLDDKRGDELDAIRDRAAELRERAADGII